MPTIKTINKFYAAKDKAPISLETTLVDDKEMFSVNYEELGYSEIDESSYFALKYEWDSYVKQLADDSRKQAESEYENAEKMKREIRLNIYGELRRVISDETAERLVASLDIKV
jgi:uncharacterized membrane-anchored protein